MCAQRERLSAQRFRALDLRAPEDKLPTTRDLSRSPEIERWIDKFQDAGIAGDDDGVRAAISGLIDANRLRHAAAGVPVHSHPPLPPDFVDDLLTSAARLPKQVGQATIGAFVEAVDRGAKPMVVQQLSAQASRSRVRRKSPPPELDPDSPEAIRQGDEADKRDWTMALAHPLAYAGDTAMDDMFGPDGLLGDWGWRRKVPPPSGFVPRVVGEGLRFYMGAKPFQIIGRVLKGVRAARAAARASRAAKP